MTRQSALDSALRALEALPEPIGGKPDIGQLVWERRPHEADHPLRGGMVIDPPENGTVLCVMAAKKRGGVELHAVRLRVGDLDPSLAEPANHARMRLMARNICAALGRGGGRWSEEDLRWLDRARDLASTP